MKLKDPIEIREMIMERKGWNTIDQIATRLRIAKNTASRALRGEPVRMTTIKRLADAVDRSVSDIAEFVN
jgi:transcriptional regulator with XRE-family HTH domain